MRLRELRSPVAQADLLFLYELLAERPDYASISHRSMPDMLYHTYHVNNHKHKYWALIENDLGATIGSIYLTTQNEIGIGIAKDWQGLGFGTEAILLLMSEFPDVPNWLANVAPGNEGSHKLFQGLGFKLVQVTYRLDADATYETNVSQEAAQ